MTKPAPEPAITRLRALLAKHRMSGVHNPGGAEVWHPTFGRLQITAMDDEEDFQAVRRFLLDHGVEP